MREKRCIRARVVCAEEYWKIGEERAWSVEGEPEECGREKSTNTVDSRRAARSVEAQSGRVKEVLVTQSREEE